MRTLVILAGLASVLPVTVCGGGKTLTISWRDLPALPQALGGQFVGVIDDHLVVAGGSYFDTAPWSGGKKKWVDTVYTLGRGDKQWKLAGHLPSPLGYGAAITTATGMLCIGGQTPAADSGKVYRLSFSNGALAIGNLADLPQPASMIAGVLAGETVYVAGGHAFWSLSLSAPDRWQTLAVWPGPSRILPLLAAAGGAIYLISGAELTGYPGPPPGRRFLTDAFRYFGKAGWERLADLPRPVQAGVALGWDGRVLVFGGSDGILAPREYELKDTHPGFSTEVLQFAPGANAWSRAGVMPCSLVTTGIVRWGDEWVIAGGEARPAKRSARVIAGTTKGNL